MAARCRLGGTDLRDLPDPVLRRTVEPGRRRRRPRLRDHGAAEPAPGPAGGDRRRTARRARRRPPRAVAGRLPAGLATWLGEGGTTISGGQRRRLAMARALLADPALLVLDEPTEGLEEQEAAALMTDLLAAATGRSVLLLTHRRDGLEHVDAVYDLVDGRLAPAVVQAEGPAVVQAEGPAMVSPAVKAVVTA